MFYILFDCVVIKLFLVNNFFTIIIIFTLFEGCGSVLAHALFRLVSV